MHQKQWRALLLALILFVMPSHMACTQGGPVTMDEIECITLNETPSFGNMETLTRNEIVLYPAKETVLFREIRMKDQEVLRETACALSADRMAALLEAAIQPLFKMQESIDTNVLDGHKTSIGIELRNGDAVRTGGLVAEEYGPAAFRRAYKAIIAASEEAMANGAVSASQSAAESDSAPDGAQQNEPVRPLLMSQYYNRAWGLTHEIVFLDRSGSIRAVRNEKLEAFNADDTAELLACLSDPANSRVIASETQLVVRSIEALIQSLPLDGIQINHHAEDAGLLRRYAFAYAEDGKPDGIVLSVEGDMLGRIETAEARALCAWLQGVTPASQYFGESLGYAYTEDDLAPLHASVSGKATSSADGRTWFYEAAGISVRIPEELAVEDITSDKGFSLQITDPNDANIAYYYTAIYNAEYKGLWMEDLRADQYGAVLEYLVGPGQYTYNPCVENNLTYLIASLAGGSQLHYILLLDGWFLTATAAAAAGYTIGDGAIKDLVEIIGSLRFDGADIDIPQYNLAFEQIPYDGEWWSFTGIRTKLYLPVDWQEYPEHAVGDAYREYVVGAADKSAMLSIRVFLDDALQINDATYQSLADDLLKNGMKEPQVCMINDVKLVIYGIGEEAGFGAVALASDSFTMLEFAPGTEDGLELFAHILSTYPAAIGPALTEPTQ